MDVLIVNFELAGITEADYRRQVETIAPMFTQVPGLVCKIWLTDAAANTYGGVYLFADASSREDYLNSDIVNSIKANPAFTNITTRGFGTFEEATNVTGGPLATELEMLRR